MTEVPPADDNPPPAAGGVADTSGDQAAQVGVDRNPPPVEISQPSQGNDAVRVTGQVAGTEVTTTTDVANTTQAAGTEATIPAGDTNTTQVADKDKVTEKELSEDDKKLALSHVNDSEVTIIGMYRPERFEEKSLQVRGADYIDTATAMKASYFDMGSRYDELSVEQRTAANEYFCDHVIAKNDVVFLSIPAHEIQDNSALWREVEYFKSRGYQYNESERLLIPPSKQ